MSGLRRLPAACLAALLALGSTGCASMFRGGEFAPSGLTRTDAELRGLLRAGDFDSTLTRLAGEDAESDDLLRLQRECRDVDFAKRAEDMEPAIQAGEREMDRKILEERKDSWSKSAQRRLARVIGKL